MYVRLLIKTASREVSVCHLVQTAQAEFDASEPESQKLGLVATILT